MVENKVETFLNSELKKKNTLLFVLIDSEVSDLKASHKLAKDVEKIGAFCNLGWRIICYRPDGDGSSS